MPAASPEHPPFLPGQYMADLSGLSASDASLDDSRTGHQFVGKEYWFDDINWGAAGPIKPLRSNLRRRLRVARNISGINLLPKRCAAIDGLLTGGTIGTGTAGHTPQGKVGGYSKIGVAAAQIPDHLFPIDEFLPATGVPDNALFYVCVEGPAMCLNDIASGATTLVAVGDAIVALTAVTSQATTAGRIARIDQAVTTPGPGTGRRILGAALSAATTTNTASDVLVNVGAW